MFRSEIRRDQKREEIGLTVSLISFKLFSITIFNIVCREDSCDSAQPQRNSFSKPCIFGFGIPILFVLFYYIIKNQIVSSCQEKCDEALWIVNPDLSMDFIVILVASLTLLFYLKTIKEKLSAISRSSSKR